MSLKSQFKTNSALARDGAWFIVCTNKDKTVCRVKLRRSGRANLQWNVVFREHGVGLDIDALSPEEDRALMGSVFAEACVADWEHLQLEDDGKETKFSIDVAKKLMQDPDWIDLRADWEAKAAGSDGFQKVLETEVKN